MKDENDSQYCIDVDEHVLEVLLYPARIRRMDERDGGDPAKIVFVNESDADQFLIRLNTAIIGLSRKHDAGIPCMRMRRRDLALIVLDVKHSTMRGYSNGWEAGTEFYTFDQTFYVRCRLSSIECIDDECFVYHFDHVRQ